MDSVTPPTPFPHPPKPCASCVPLMLERGQRSGLWLCGRQLWRVIADPQAHLFHRKGDAVCWETGLWERAKGMGADLLVVHVDGHILTTDRQTFECHGFGFSYPSWGDQIGMARRHWCQHKRGADVGLQFAFALEPIP